MGYDSSQAGAIPALSAMLMLNNTPVLKEDVDLFYMAKPDPTFSAERNLSIIKQVMDENIQNYKKYRKKTIDQIGERVEVLTSYLMHLVNKNDSTPIDKYIGTRYLAQLRGERLIDRIKKAGRKNGYYL